MFRKILSLVMLFSILLAACAQQSEVQNFDERMLEDIEPAPAGPIGALYVFGTTAKTQGDGGGRMGMNAICTSEDPASHFCTLSEIENAFQTTGVYFNDTFNQSVNAPPENQAWLDDPMGGAEWGSNVTCYAWTSTSYDTSAVMGRVLYRFATKYDSVSCQASLSVACCKWIK